MTKLTPKQENFCNYYIETGNASEAYRRAYSCENMKDETVNERSCRLLKEYKISTRVSQLQADLQERSDISKDEAVKELTNIVRARVTDVLFARGTTIKIKNLEELPDHVVSCISVMKKVKGGIEIKLYDKISAIDRLSKMLGWDGPTRVDLQGSVNTSFLEQMSDEELEEFIRS
ncbi:MAG: terminase small subunit [Clostridia bacterium]|nr:terminase small subunit [Clostridia bacterium]